jgi:hypothetical protein
MILKLPSKSKKLVQSTPLLLILFFTLARLAFGGFNFSYFVVAGSDFVDQETAAPGTIINEGQGYDGQFFYRYAHDPLNKEKTAFGVTVDHIEYRIQRIVYPATAWILSMGGHEGLVPFTLVFCNLLAFLGLFYISKKICEIKNINPIHSLLPLFLFGAYMSLARDTSELFEVFFFAFAVYAIVLKRVYWFVLGVLLSVFSRETSIIALAPLTLVYSLSLIKNNKFTLGILLKIASLAIPFIAIVLWKYYLHSAIGTEELVDGSQNLSMPFYGIYLGILSSINFSDFTHSIETVFWFLFFIWNLVFAVTVIKRIEWKSLFNMNLVSMLGLVYLFWTIFSLILGHAIYIDDWGFVRIFALWNMLGFLIIMLINKPLKRIFLGYSTVILALTIVRLVIRV